MNYEKTRRLLFEPHFLEDVSNLYEDFISLDSHDYEFYLANQMNFYLSYKSWENKYNDKTKTRLFNGLAGTFAQFIKEKFTKYVMDDWIIYNDKLKESPNPNDRTGQFKKETLEIIEIIPQREHLILVADILNKALSRIADSPELPAMLNEPGITGNVIPPLKWCGQLDTLYTLFYDLRNSRSTITGEFFLEASNDEIISFIMANFLNKDGQAIDSKTSIKTYLDPTRKDKKARKERFVLTLNSKDPEA